VCGEHLHVSPSATYAAGNCWSRPCHPAHEVNCPIASATDPALMWRPVATLVRLFSEYTRMLPPVCNHHG
jgi:hypothetical protein